MQQTRGRFWGSTGMLVVTGLLAACQPSVPLRAPPVEDRGVGAGSFSGPATSPAPAAPSVAVAPPKPLPGAENAGKPGFYTVRPGDTVRKIAQDNGQNFRDIIRWNDLSNPDLIEVGQVLRVVPPTGPAVAATPAPPPAVASAPAAAPRPAAGGDEGNVSFSWPVPSSTAIVGTFDEAKNNKGLNIGGKAGEPVVAAADGKVIYAGSSLRGYGNLVIVQHSNGYMTAYAHNQALLVKEDQTVRRNQKIAEMGSSDADRVMLHFEIRRDGKPVDPSRYLPSSASR